MYVSPRHHHWDLPDKPINEWDIEIMVDYFHACVDGWHLEVADRCINGWKDANGDDCITGHYLDGRLANYIVDSGWAALQITLNYFEVIAFFKSGGRIKQNEQLFHQGVDDVFPECRGKNPNVASYLWKSLRIGLYHGSPISGKHKGAVVLTHNLDLPPIFSDRQLQQIIIDPHRFVQRLRGHLNGYCSDLLDISNSQLRHDFKEAFRAKYE